MRLERLEIRTTGRHLYEVVKIFDNGQRAGVGGEHTSKAMARVVLLKQARFDGLRVTGEYTAAV